MEQTPQTSTVNDAAAALALADSSLATPETPTATTPAAAVTPPVETPSPGSDATTDDPRSPFIPRARFDEVIAARTKAEEGLKRYDGFKDYAPEQLTDLIAIGNGLRTDAVGTVSGLLDQMLAHPALGPALQAKLTPLAGKWLAAARGAKVEPADPEPEPDLQSPDGTLVYSAPRQKEWREWNNRQLTATLTKGFEEKLQPLQKVAQTFEQREAAAAYQSTTGQVIAALEARDPDFKAHKADVWKVIDADPRLLHMALAPETAEMAIDTAWNRVYREKVVPEQLKHRDGQTLSHLQQRAVAATTSPAAATTSTPKTTLGDARAALEFASQATGG